ncbi:unnamed protein product [Penicillium salamii]|nr:unnamed protein product [Penicillium salamii]
MLLRIKALSSELTEVVPSENKNETVQVIHQSVNNFLRKKGLQALYHNIVYLATIYILTGTSGLKGTKEGFIQEHSLIYYTTTNLFIYTKKAAEIHVDILQDEKEILQRVLSF